MHVNSCVNMFFHLQSQLLLLSPIRACRVSNQPAENNHIQSSNIWPQHTELNKLPSQPFICHLSQHFLWCSRREWWKLPFFIIQHWSRINTKEKRAKQNSTAIVLKTATAFNYSGWVLCIFQAYHLCEIRQYVIQHCRNCYKKLKLCWS